MVEFWEMEASRGLTCPRQRKMEQGQDEIEGRGGV